MIKIAITGTIGSGKSFVGKIIKEKGFSVLDLDKTAKEVRDNEAKKSIIDLFGSDDPKVVSDKVFKNPNYLNKLNELMHPLILKRMISFFDQNMNNPFVFVEVPLLYELGWEKYFDYSWCVSCNQQTTIERLVNYRGYSIDRAIEISETQLSDNEKVSRADFVIENNIDSTVDNIQKRIDEELRKYVD